MMALSPDISMADAESRVHVFGEKLDSVNVDGTKCSSQLFQLSGAECSQLSCNIHDMLKSNLNKTCQGHKNGLPISQFPFQRV